MTDRKLVLLFAFVVALAANALIVPVSFSSQGSTHSYLLDSDVVGTPSDLSHTRSILPLFIEGEVSSVAPLKATNSHRQFGYIRFLSDKRLSQTDVYSQGPPFV